MRRKAWFEFHDHPLYPGFLRDLFTDALQAMWNTMAIYSPIATRLQQAIATSGAERIVDLCSGGGGPWLRFSREIQCSGRACPLVLLTDKYPSRSAIRSDQGTTVDGLSFYPHPVDAMEIPADLTGFRTIFSTFHHFDPAEAHAILKSAFEQRQGIGIFEAAKCSLRTLASSIAVPLLALRLAPRIRPFRWKRMFWTYCLPVIPLTLWVDGILSCLRSYSQADLRELTSGLTSEAYCWEVGEEHGGPVAITYLVGYPCLSARHEDPASQAAEMQSQAWLRPTGAKQD
jgi:hypothetical protein